MHVTWKKNIENYKLEYWSLHEKFLQEKSIDGVYSDINFIAAKLVKNVSSGRL